MQQIGGAANDQLKTAGQTAVKVIFWGTASIATVLVIKYVADKWVTKYLFERPQPKLIENKSPGGLWHYFSSFIVADKSTNINDLTNHMVIDEKLKKELSSIMNMATNTKKNNGQFGHVLLYGPPGTGKTLFAQLLTEYCGMKFAFVPAANVSQFLTDGTAVKELNELFSWAENNQEGTIIFLDEIEKFLANRKSLSDNARNALTAFLTKTGTPSDKYIIVGTTNIPEELDNAVLSRFSTVVSFTLPDLKARQDQLAMHIKDVFGRAKKPVDHKIFNESYNGKLAQRLEGASGRDIQQFINKIYQLALANNATEISQEIVDEAHRCMEEKKKLEHIVSQQPLPKT